MKKLIMLRGNSGSGKTTVAKALQQKLGHNVMLISQDVIRRDMLRVHDGAGTLALPLLKELLLYGYDHCEVVIIEGILNSRWYRSLFELSMELYGDNIFAYYFDLTFEETLSRHQTKPNRDDFGEREMRQWWNEKDFISMIPETAISDDMCLADTIAMILNDIAE